MIYRLQITSIKEVIMLFNFLSSFLLLHLPSPFFPLLYVLSLHFYFFDFTSLPFLFSSLLFSSLPFPSKLLFDLPTSILYYLWFDLLSLSLIVFHLHYIMLSSFHRIFGLVSKLLNSCSFRFPTLFLHLILSYNCVLPFPGNTSFPYQVMLKIILINWRLHYYYLIFPLQSCAEESRYIALLHSSTSFMRRS